MRVYRTQGLESRLGEWSHLWSGSQRAAATDRRKMRELGLDSVSTEQLDVPLDKAGLLAWLNAHCSGD